MGVAGMARLLVAVDPETGISSADLAAAWDRDEQARAWGPAVVEPSGRGNFFPDVLTLVVIPLAVNVASTAACALVSRLVSKLRPGPPAHLEIDLAGSSNGEGDLVVVVRI